MKKKKPNKFSWKKTLDRVLLALVIFVGIALIENIMLAVVKFVVNLIK